jgi:hypothetical protein
MRDPSVQHLDVNARISARLHRPGAVHPHVFDRWPSRGPVAGVKLGSS